MIPLKFTAEDYYQAFDEWGANCGPGAIAGVLGLSLNELRPSMGNFEKKHYTNPKLMIEVLKRLNVSYVETKKDQSWPKYGLCRIQWEGPWSSQEPHKSYRHTHWIGVDSINPNNIGIFDINCMMANNGWVPLEEWKTILIPWLRSEIESDTNGKWHLTHSIEISI